MTNPRPPRLGLRAYPKLLFQLLIFILTAARGGAHLWFGRAVGSDAGPEGPAMKTPTATLLVQSRRRMCWIYARGEVKTPASNKGWTVAVTTNKDGTVTITLEPP